MQIINLDAIKPVLDDKPAILETVKQGFIQHSQGKISLPEPVQMLFGVTDDAIGGDCHIKTASSEGLPYFCIKVATGFYENPAKGLPVNNGLVILMSSETGTPLALFQDQGHLTSIRTAAAGALAASLIQKRGPASLGVIGTGHQAALQIIWISETQTLTNIVIWGRSNEKARALQAQLASQGIKVDIAHSVADLCAQSTLIVTTTPATSPLVFSEHMRPGHHIIAMGSDSPGKTELDPKILKRADLILTDDHAQCLHHGEFGQAVRAGLISETKDVAFGHALEHPDTVNLNDQSLSVVDLTGLGAQDLAISTQVYNTLQESRLKAS